MHKIIFDTNVILSGILYGGTPGLLLKKIQNKSFILCTSQQLFDEIFNKLIYKFRVDKYIIYEASLMLNYGVIYTPTCSVHFPEDKKDSYLLELAEESNAAYLVTGDKKHLLPLKKWKNTRIVTPKQAIDILQ